MTEYSQHWAGLSTGDAVQAPYSDAEFSSYIRHFLNADRTTQGVLAGVDNELAVTGASSPVSVATGAAMVLGRLYQNITSAVTVAVPTPAVSSRIDVICLQSDTAAQTIRAGRHAGVEGGGTPALTQTDALWEVPLANCTITTAGAITLTDVRRMLRSPGGPGAEYALLAADDGAHNNFAWSTLGGPTGLSVSLTAGRWYISGIVRTRTVGDGDRYSRLYNVTSAATVAESRVWMYDATAGQLVVGPVVYDITALNEVRLDYYGAATDTVAGSATILYTGLSALRLPDN